MRQKEWIKYIMEIDNVCKKYNETIKRNVASEYSIDILKKWVSDNVSKNLWVKDYEEFLKIQNGFEFDGLIFYGTTDFENDLIDMNKTWDWQGESFDHRYLFLGDADISWFVYDIRENSFAELDKPSGELIETFNDFDNMLLSAIQTRVNI